MNPLGKPMDLRSRSRVEVGRDAVDGEGGRDS